MLRVSDGQTAMNFAIQFEPHLSQQDQESIYQGLLEQIESETVDGVVVWRGPPG
jgi:hypothetical protein